MTTTRATQLLVAIIGFVPGSPPIVSRPAVLAGASIGAAPAFVFDALVAFSPPTVATVALASIGAAATVGRGVIYAAHGRIIDGSG